MSDATWLVVGLGNPGPAYAGNRHNVGLMVVDLLAERAGASFKAHAVAAPTWSRHGSAGLPVSRAVLAKPRSYMNESGGSGRARCATSTRSARAAGRRPRRARHPVRPLRLKRAAATTATTA